ncbi:MAG: hypothetical protein JXA43_01920 [Candidatus Diapherotrites archaeon]|nr:hypothetical protein [Candidatus Diapherotrites archaeon]
MNKRGFWQPIVFILAISLIMIFFGMMFKGFTEQILESQSAMKDQVERQADKVEADYDIYDQDGGLVVAGYDSDNGFWVINEGNSNLYNIDIYWQSPSHATMCKLVEMAQFHTTLDDFTRSNNFNQVDYTTIPGSVIIDWDDLNMQYYANGSFESYPISSGIGVDWTTIESNGLGFWPHQIFKFQLRSAATRSDLTLANYIGPDLTNGTYYEAGSETIMGHDNNPWIQYKAFLETDDLNQTPQLDDVRIRFQLPDTGHSIEELLRGQSIMALAYDSVCTNVPLEGEFIASQDSILVKTLHESRVRYVP